MKQTPPPSDPGSVADDQLLDALLRGRMQDSPAATNERIDRVMAAIETDSAREPAATSVGLRWRSHPLGRALAAGLLMATITGLALIVVRPLPADANLLQRAIERLADGDLTYLVNVTTNADGAARNDPNGTRPRVDGRRMTRGNRKYEHPGRRCLEWRLRPAGQPRDFKTRQLGRLDGAIMHTRGDRSVLLIDAHDDQVVARGFDGSNFWNNFQRSDLGDSGAPDDQTDGQTDGGGRTRMNRYLEFITRDLAEKLQGLERRYDLTEPTLVEDADGGSPLVLQEAVRKKSGRDGFRSSRNPERIELWTEPETERIVLCRLQFQAEDAGRRATTIEFTLASTSPLDEGVFEAENYPPIIPRRRPSSSNRQPR